GEYSCAFCTNIGKIVSIEINKLNEKTDISATAINTGTFKTRSSNIGFGKRNCLIEKSTNAKAPTLKLIIVNVSIGPPSCNCVNPYNILPKPIIDRKIDVKSIFVSLCSVMFLMNKYIIPKISRAIGRATKNKVRHSKYSIITPDIGGPTAGATF